MAQSENHRNIILPLDASDHSMRAFEWYVYNLKKSGDILIFVHIVEPQYASSVIAIADTIKFKLDDDNDGTSKKAKDLIQKFVKLAESHEVQSKGIITADSKPGDGIVKVSMEQGASMVIIGNRGIGTIRRTILGSTSDFLMSHVNVPVIIVPPPK